MLHRPQVSRLHPIFPWLLVLLSAVSLAIWIYSLGTTLVNDEYAALDYAYRVLHQGGFYPTPHRLHKPLAVISALIALPAGPIGYEFLTAAWAAALVLFSFLAVRRASDEAGAVVAALLIASNPDLFLNTAYGITAVPLLAGAFICIHALLGMKEQPVGLWRYALVAFLIGLLRPDAWLFVIPLVAVFWTRRREWSHARFLLAAGLIGLAPLIWFGKDWLINDNLFQSVKVATADRTVGLAKVQFTAMEALAFFPKHIVPRISWPTFLSSLAGVIVFVYRRRLSGLFHPLLLFPLLISGFVWFLIMTGVYPIQRYFFFTAVFLLVFASWLWVELGKWTRAAGSPWRWMGLGAAAALAGLHFYAAEKRFEFNYRELAHEARIQREMFQMADTLKALIPPGRQPLILLPSRRDEQLSWLFRDREIPNTIGFREVYYYQFQYNYSFLNWGPAWILYIDQDFHWHWVSDEFQWLNTQDRTELQGARIELFFHTDLIRLFTVTYPPGWQAPPHPPLLYQ